MKKIKQTKLQSESVNGNCMATCFASILEIEISDVPEFEEMFHTEHWFQKIEEWFLGLGVELIRFKEDPKLKGYYLVSGDSPRGNFLHMVVYKNGKMVHDPHPSGDGINSLYDVWVLIQIDPSKYITLK